ncbi:tripartite tricarboxylate transporter TctB family protein [Ottowia thiooxydans]|uniref:tripartite tricarboxylate transporter TctB family protein n=1 Tax=Ottowia thiooxydans TaxID=219182 RepID=UPI00068573C7|nr:tripartite tricarboxylate transporter TctB family protein [Ottowia thiooxydans]
MFATVGAAFAIGAFDYTVGSAARMGPGYFPLMVGVLLTVLGSAVALSAVGSSPGGNGEPVGRIAWKPLGFIIGANLLFGVLLAGVQSLGLPAMGLIVAVYALVIVSCMAGAAFSMKASLVLATVLAVGSYLTFVLGLGLQFQVWPTFISS